MGESKKTIKILITGGHHTPAFAVLKELQKQFSILPDVASGSRPKRRDNCQLSVIWVGHKFSMVGDRAESLEYKETRAQGITFINLATPRFHRRSRFLFGLRFCVSVVNSLKILFFTRPHLVFSFGGYLSSPIVLAAWLLGIPSLTHEQTSAAGFANRFNAWFCQKVLISFESSRKYFPKEKTFLTGNPVRPEIFEDKGSFKFANDLPTIYVTGGKQGSHLINELMVNTLPRLLAEFNVIHQAGSSTVFNDYNSLFRLSEGWPDDLKKNYLLRDHFSVDQIGSVLARANLVISRAGANIVCELAVLRKRSILIPLSGSSHREQEQNARLLEKLGLAEVIEEPHLSIEKLFLAVEKLKSGSKVKVDDKKIETAFPRDAAKKISVEVLELLKIETV